MPKEISHGNRTLQPCTGNRRAVGAQVESMIALTTTKSSYLCREPIALKLSVNNNSARTKEFLAIILSCVSPMR
jgi:hypothetical protein